MGSRGAGNLIPESFSRLRESALVIEGHHLVQTGDRLTSPVSVITVESRPSSGTRRLASYFTKRNSDAAESCESKQEYLYLQSSPDPLHLNHDSYDNHRHSSNSDRC